MMSNYQRTMELTGYATNSAGASQKQFEKTMESLESKLNRLHNAWENFTTGIAKASTIKGAVDLLTALLTAINKITEATDPAHTGITKILAAILGFKAAKSIVNGVLRNIGTQIATGMGKEGTKAAGTFLDRFINKINTTSSKIKFNIKPENTQQVINNGAMRAAATAEATAAEEAYTKALERQQIALSNQEQAKARLSALEQEKARIQESGIILTGSDTAATELDNKITKAKIELGKADAEVDAANAGALEAETQAQIANTNAKNIDHNSDKIGLLTKLNLYRVLLFGNKAHRQEARQALAAAGAKWAEAGATNTATGAQLALNKAIENCPIGWILVGIGAIVGLAVALAASIETDEEKLERLNKTAENSAEAFQQATEQLNNIKNSQSDLEALNQELEDLTSGTDEWKQKLVEVNAQVLELIKTYPALADYMYSDNGQLKILDEGWDKLIEKQNEVVQNASVASISANALLSAQQAHMSKDTTGNFNKGIEYDSYNIQVSHAIISDLLSGDDESAFSEKYSDVLAQSLATNDISSEIEKLKSNISANTKEYAKLMGMTEEEVRKAKENEELTDDQIKNALATDKYTKQIIGSLEKLNVKLRSLDGTVKGDIFQSLITSQNMSSNTFKQFLSQAHDNKIFEEQTSFEDFVTLSNEQIENGLKEYFSKVYDISESELAAMNINISGVVTNFYDDIYQLKDIFENTTKIGITSVVQDYIASLEKLTGLTFDTAETEALADALASVSQQGGNIKDFQNNLTSIIKNLDGEQIKPFLQKLQGLDWSTGSNIMDTLASFGSSIDKNVRQKLIQATNATKDYALVTEQEQKNEIDFIVKLQKLNSDNTHTLDLTDEDDAKLAESIKQLKGDTLTEEIWNKYFQFDEDLNQINIVGSLEEVIHLIQQANSGVQNAIIAQKNYKDAIQQATEANNTLAKIQNREKNDLSFSEPNQWKFVYSGYLSNKLDNEGNAQLTDNYQQRMTVGGDLKLHELWTANDEETQKEVAQTFSIFDQGVEQFGDSVTNLEDLIKLMLDTDLLHTQEDYLNAGTGLSNGMSYFDTTDDDILRALAYRIQTDDNFKNSLSNKDFSYIASSIVQMANNGVRLSESQMDYWLTEVEDGVYALNKDLVSQEAIKLSDDIIQAYKQGLITEEQKKDIEAISDYAKRLQAFTDAVKERANAAVLNAQKAKNIADRNVYNSTMSASEILAINPQNGTQQNRQIEVLDLIIKKHEGWQSKLQSIQDEYGYTVNEAKKVLAVQYEQNEATDQVLKILNDYENALKNTGTEKYYAAIDKLVEQFKKLFGEDIDSKWVVNNLELIKQLSEGGEKANAVMKKLAETAEAKPISINIQLKDNDIYNELDSLLSKMLADVEKDSGEINKDINSIQTVLNKLDNSSATIEVKANTERAFAELLRVGLVDAITTNNKKKFNSLYALAAASGFSTAGIGKVINAKVVNGQVTYELDENAAAYAGNVDVRRFVQDENGNWRGETWSERYLNSYTHTEVPGGQGSGNNDSSSSKDSSNSNDNDNEDDWTNDWSLQYALLKKIAAIERERNRLDKEHNRWVKSYALMESDIVKNKEKQRKNLMKQIDLNKDLAQQTRNELESLNWYSGFGGSIWYDQENNMIRTNDANIRAMDEKTKKAFDDVKSQYESLASQLETAKDNIESAVEAIEELTSAITEIDYQTQIDNLLTIIDHTLTLYEKAEARLQRSNRTTTKKDVLNLFNASSKERVNKNKLLTEQYVRSGAQLSALLNLGDYQKYYNFDWDTGKLTRNSAYYSLGDSDLKDKIDARLTKIEDLAKQRRTADEEREDLADEQYEAEKAIAEKANEWQKNVYEAVVSEREEEISKLETINTSIQDASSKLIDSMQKSIQKIRQDRKNEKTEEELSDMQSKLAYLQADTSGANEVEIKKLQKQLSEKQESYTDTLIDQKISELQDQNKEAAEQRKMQIEIAKAQLQYDKQTGAIWSEVRGLIAVGLSSNGTVNKNSELGKLLTKWGNVNSLSAYDKQEYWAEQNYGSASYGANNSISNGGGYQNQFGYTVTSSQYNSMRNSMIKEAKAALSDYVNSTTPYKDYMRYDSSKNTLIQTQLFPYPEGDEKALHDTLEAAWRSIWERINYINGLSGYFDVNSANTLFTQTPSIARHAKGGLVDYTGLHWLDGTTSEPELVLNAKDTQNFLALKDILSGVMKNSSTIPHNNGDVNCEITINVDSISNDYDVDQIAKRIEYNIMQSANWRNVNNLSMMR